MQAAMDRLPVVLDMCHTTESKEKTDEVIINRDSQL